MPRRKGRVLDAKTQSLLHMWPAYSPQGCISRNPDHYRSHPAISSSDRHPSWETALARQLPAPTSYRMADGPAGRGQNLVPLSTLDLYPRLTSTKTSCRSPLSTLSKKHSLKPKFKGSPQPKRRPMADVNDADPSLRYSVPCPPPSSDFKGSERHREGLLRRNNTSAQYFPPITSYFDSERETICQAPSSTLLEPFQPRPWRVNEINMPSATQLSEFQKGHLFWPRISPSALGNSVSGASQRNEKEEEQEARSRGSIASSRFWSGSRTTITSVGRVGTSETTGSSADQQPEDENETWRHGKNPSMDTPHTLEDTRCTREGRRNKEINQVGDQVEETLVSMCGKGLYPDWAGSWGK